ncbi:MAG: myo-inositol-1(or 4)-monophosphatase [Candidatus Tokpelaia sp. JSC188]|nr:MAG: myo-inositol-1(or 4)-monophosphatase [Candidatus Tokpelaia sp. JSC188]
MARSAIMNVMVQAAMKAGRSLSRDFGEVQNLQVSLKGPANYVSQANKRAAQIICNELQRARPSYSFLIEQINEIKGNDDQHRFIASSLDSTINFLHGIPLFAISISLERQRKVIASVIYNPVIDELFTAERGCGAFLNDHRLRVSSRRNLFDSVIGTSIPHLRHSKHDHYLIELRSMMAEVSGIRCTGSTALDLAYVAAGRFDGFWENDPQNWNIIAAGVLMIREAGGFISNKQGEEDVCINKSIVAGNELVYNALMKILKK